MARRRLSPVVVAIVLLAAFSGPTAASPSMPTVDSAKPEPASAFLCSVSGRVTTPPLATAAVAKPASDLRIALGRLLGEHAYLVMEAMRAAAQDRPDFDALDSGLEGNSRALASAIASVYGDDAGAAFSPIWQQHIDAMFAWARATAGNDTVAKHAALAEMQDYRAKFGAFLKGANPRISGDAEAHALQLHLDQLTSFVGMDYEQAFATERAAYSHMFDFGDHLARQIVAQFPDRFPDGKVAFSPSTTLRLTLGRLLGEHLVLAAEAMRSGLLERVDAAAAAAALGANGADLAAVVGKVFGADAQGAFADVWGLHVKAYLDYIDAVREGDAAGRQTALDSLHTYHRTLADFLHGAIPSLSVADLESLISHHVSALVSQVDAAAAGDHARAVTVTREAYAQMFEVGDALGTGIAAQFPERFGDVRDLPPTDTATRTDAPIAVLLGLLFLGVAIATRWTTNRSRYVRRL
jgi:hypothetical protein